MQTQLSENGDARNSDARDRELEAESFEALIREIWRRFTEEPIEMRRSCSGFQTDASTNL